MRLAGSRLELFPPGLTLGYVVLTEQPTDSGVLYTRRDAEFRMNGDLATVTLGNERHVDCVSNPAAAVWEAAPGPRATR